MDFEGTVSKSGYKQLEAWGLKASFWNLGIESLYERSIADGEGHLVNGGVLAVRTGVHTGRSAADKFTVRDATTEDQVWWQNNKSITSENFALLWQDFQEHMKDKSLYVQDLYAGADKSTQLPLRVITEYAWHSAFIRHLLRRPELNELADFESEFTIIDLPSFQANPERHGVRSETVIAIDIARKLVLIGGTSYAGEIKKSAFTLMNYLLPPQGVMPMHCSVNVGNEGDSAIFFGLSGTGKTTLSADPERNLIGDDEHGWSERGLFNFEGGCYAKVIRLSPQAEPEIYKAVNSFGAILENVVYDSTTRKVDFDSAVLAENTRGAYPIDYIDNADLSGVCGHPRNVIMLTADAYGIMPPIAQLTPDQAMYHFLSGYTAKVAGVEKGIKKPEATFSTCFGAPFMPRRPAEYGALLRDLIVKHNAKCWLVNTGWTGGRYGVGSRMPIAVTRTLLKAALDGSLVDTEFRVDSNFGFYVPVSVPGVPQGILDPRSTWADKELYDQMANDLVARFIENFETLDASAYVEEKLGA